MYNEVDHLYQTWKNSLLQITCDPLYLSLCEKKLSCVFLGVLMPISMDALHEKHFLL